MNDLNFQTWYLQRELFHCPPHFVITKTPTTDESIYWILERLLGRFYLHKVYGEEFGGYQLYPFFEDPQEAILYELTWS